MKDRKVAKFVKDLAELYPETTMVFGVMPDSPDSGELAITLLNAPEPLQEVQDTTFRMIEERWPWRGPGKTFIPVVVFAVNRADTAKYHAHELKTARPSRTGGARSKKRLRATAS